MTAKQRRFVEEYCVDWNATQAAIRAGYSEKTARQIGSRLLSDVDISAAISERAKALAMSLEEALIRLGDMARASIADVASAEKKDGLKQHVLRLDPGKAIAEGKGHLIKEIKQTDSGVEVKMYDAQSALDKIMRAHGAYGVKGTADDPLHIKPVELRIVKPDQ